MVPVALEGTRLHSSHTWISYAVFCLETNSVAATGSDSSPVAGVTLTPLMACAVFSSSVMEAVVAATDGVSETGLTVIATVAAVDGALAAAPVFFFNDTATTEIYTLSLHDALPIWLVRTLLTSA